MLTLGIILLSELSQNQIPHIFSQMWILDLYLVETGEELLGERRDQWEGAGTRESHGVRVGNVPCYMCTTKPFMLCTLMKTNTSK